MTDWSLAKTLHGIFLDRPEARGLSWGGHSPLRVSRRGLSGDVGRGCSAQVSGGEGADESGCREPVPQRSGWARWGGRDAGGQRGLRERGRSPFAIDVNST